ncbi:hypothetical protein CAL15_20470 [Bordetella genomosp. 13]|uniref:Uncharacterized protein n=2 Tax=Bordetella genomosp. 13 TaxID=463040 RepID=A0A1W6ZGU9_9BORD|nr:hypothetical protein CAL15_20470 [Bordetella genomosp. 13]
MNISITSDEVRAFFGDKQDLYEKHVKMTRIFMLDEHVQAQANGLAQINDAFRWIENGNRDVKELKERFQGIFELARMGQADGQQFQGACQQLEKLLGYLQPVMQSLGAMAGTGQGVVDTAGPAAADQFRQALAGLEKALAGCDIGVIAQNASGVLAGPALAGFTNAADKVLHAMSPITQAAQLQLQGSMEKLQAAMQDFRSEEPRMQTLREPAKAIHR